MSQSRGLKVNLIEYGTNLLEKMPPLVALLYRNRDTASDSRLRPLNGPTSRSNPSGLIAARFRNIFFVELSGLTIPTSLQS